MRILTFETFVEDFGRAAEQTMNMSIYRDNFDCACGRSHWFDESISVICQGWGMKVIVVCPSDSAFLTSVKVKTFMVVKFKGFESLAGTELKSDEDVASLLAIRRMFGAG